MGQDTAKCIEATGGDSGDLGSARKHTFRPYHAIRVPKSANLQTPAGQDEISSLEPSVLTSEVTTLMLRHIPNKYTQATLLQELNRIGFAGRYDFFYLPMDVHNRTNVGYAFINFLTPQDASRFTACLTNYKFQKFSSQKIATVSPAHIQGLARNLAHFSHRAVAQSRDIQYRPIVVHGGCYRDCSEVLAEMLPEGANSKPQHHSHDPLERSGLNPSAKVFIPGGSSDRLPCGDGDMLPPAEVQHDGAAVAVEDPSAALQLPWHGDHLGVLSVLEQMSVGAAPVEQATCTESAASAEEEGTVDESPDDFEEFEKAVFTWLQDDVKGTSTDMQSTDDNSSSSASGHVTPHGTWAWPDNAPGQDGKLWPGMGGIEQDHGFW